ncbi:hypothetical protein C3L33_20968, partial [Rhododendron williamsianum]
MRYIEIENVTFNSLQILTEECPIHEQDLCCRLWIPQKIQHSRQCEFFQWCDEPLLTGDRHLDELNLIRSECIRLQERIDDIQQEWDNERADWNRERTELTSELSTVKAELDKIKNEIKLVNESVVMPPLDKLSEEDEEEDDALVIQTL